MARDLQTRFFAVILALLSVAAVVFAWINFQKEIEFSAPSDGVWWVEDGSHLRAARVDIDGPGQKAGIKLGDRLVAVDGRDVTNVGSLERQLYRAGIWSKANYSLVRQGVNLEAPLILAPADRSLFGGLRLIALVYLGIGIYVLLRRWTAPKSTHFYVFCLVSFIFYSFHYTGKLNDFDWIIYWSNVVAWLLQPALFLHFSLTFPERKGLVNRRPWLIPAVYVPGAILLAAHICILELLQPSEVLRWNLDRLQMSYLAAYFVLSAAVLWHTYRHAGSAILRQQMKWVTRGTILAVAPFTLFYVIPYLAGSPPVLWMLMKISVLSLVFLPLTFGYAIFRYRLMDVDLIFKRGMAYTIAAGAITGAYFAAVGIASELFHQRFPSVGPIGLIVAIAVITACRGRWRWAALLYPALTLLVVVVTANHFWLDGAVAIVLVLGALGVQRAAGSLRVRWLTRPGHTAVPSSPGHTAVPEPAGGLDAQSAPEPAGGPDAEGRAPDRAGSTAC